MTIVDGLELTVGTELPALELPPISRGDAGAVRRCLAATTTRSTSTWTWPESAGFDDVFAHGMLSMAYLGRLLTDWAPQDRLMSWTARFVAITPVHGAPTCTRTGRSRSATAWPRSTSRSQLADGTTTLTGEAVIAL